MKYLRLQLHVMYIYVFIGSLKNIESKEVPKKRSTKSDLDYFQSIVIDNV